ncbi:ammonia-forming cytochrome c nitrite reductase subunit c552 [uncultured Mailhella sp.]|uniref:ammonia-forming cytochrome c nitrite reductase subunit c552 n=1 Tax=uncultured Mailhella sp. TaxID=1981031 RepID=UPI0025E546E2|nr:ammonia-forming cytochrome c nitrite reductase subunit c552 [uncultured Mailhella sp.]
MNKMNMIMTGAVLACCLISAGCQDDTYEVKTPVYQSGLPANTLDASKFEKAFPLQYASYRQNDESSVMTEYKGSVNFRKNDNVNPLPRGFHAAQPYLKNLWLGYPFMYEYNEARGHTYAVKDILDIDRINRYSPDGKGNMPTTCWNCKVPAISQWVAAEGDGVWSRDFNEYRTKVDVMNESISCATCHDTTTMELQLYSIPLKDWLARSGKDWATLSRNEKRSLVCGQCHVEYYFTHKDNGPAGKPVFPWDNGFDPEDMYEYYNTHGANNGPFTDFVHAVSGVNIIKAQHPEYETWQNGPHGAAGVSCADCHMPYVKQDGKKYSSHWWTSPLKDPELTACRTCHSDKTPEFLRARVHDIQEKTYRQLLKAQETSVKAHEAVRLANEFTGERNANYESLMAAARENVRKGQFFWDLISAENSVGFHNPAKALDTLMSSMGYSQKAIDLCIEATNAGIAANLAGDIKDIVPPILEFNRKMQQDPEVMKSHKWLTYLPVLPEAGLVWEGNVRVK